MLVALWSLKGGQGTTVAAALCALSWASTQSEVLLIDLGGDLPAALGVSDLAGPGCAEWLRSDGPADPAALARLEVPVAARLRLLPRGSGPLDSQDRGAALVAGMAAESRLVVVDCGDRLRVGGAGLGLRLATEAGHSWLVTRPCYLALTKAIDPPVQPSGVILCREPGRALGAHDVSTVTGAPVVAQVAIDPGIARCVDAGLLATRVPRRLSTVLASVRPDG